MQLNFNASHHNPQTTPEPVDTAWYPVTITSAEEKPNKAGSGSYLELGLTIQQGPNARRVVKARLNLKHPNPQTVEIAQGELSAICHVTGRMQLQHAQQLLGANMQAYIVKAPRNDRPGQFSNDVQGYRDMNGNEPGQGGNHGGFAGQGGGQQQGQHQNYGGGQQGGGYDPNANQQGNGGGWQGNNQQGGNAGGYDQNNQGGNWQGNNNGGYQQNNNGGGNFDQNQQGGGQGGYQQGPNGGYQQQGNGQGQNFGNGNGQGGNQQGNGGPAGGGNMPSWA